jgi:pSer/pThr/pTyr-binding forkhead associated (FHA) protein
MAILAQLVDGVIVNRFSLDKEIHSIGRDYSCDIAIDDISVSANHAEIEARENDYLDGYFEYFIRDLGSTNGTFLNDNDVIDELPLKNGDKVRVAFNEFKFINDDERDFDKTAQILD